MQFSREDIDSIVGGLPPVAREFIARQFDGYIPMLDAYVTVGEHLLQYYCAL